MEFISRKTSLALRSARYAGLVIPVYATTEFWSYGGRLFMWIKQF